MNPPTSKPSPLLLLFGRSALFLLIQALFAGGFFLAGRDSAWNQGAAWWPFTVTFTNLLCLAAMGSLFRVEGKNYWEIFRIRRGQVRRDLLALFASLVIALPLAVFPNLLLGSWLFGDPQAPLELFLRPLPLWAACAGAILFPVTQGLAELPVYFLYAMPRLDGRRFPDLRPVILPALMLGLQHFAIPFVFDIRFIVWRALMFIPFAFAVGIILHWRPRLLPYLAVVHVLMDLSFAAMLIPMAY
jgi:hypothetical protein